MSAGADRNSYDTAASGDAQGNLATVIGLLENVLNTRDNQVKQAMANFQADGVSDEYHGKEMQWNKSAHEVRTIIALCKTTLVKNDGSATTALSQAKSAVGGIA